jgi:gamma-glutamylcyclotransferase (GGCT)/AIG2-like uncharacterized protein YtfP
MKTSTQTVLLFSYGSLQNKAVQLANFGRELKGRADFLPRYARRLIPILNPKEVAATGESHYASAEATSNSDDLVAGTVFEITEQELAAADEYESPANYHRVLVTLQSGVQAWVYVHSSH